MTSIQRWFAALTIVMLAFPADAGVRHPAVCAGADVSSQQTTGEPAGEDELEEDEEPDCE